ncbi:unnamed protein product, partial [Prorocentrum cordatum]
METYPEGLDEGPGQARPPTDGAEGEECAEGGEATGVPAGEHEIDINAPIKRLIHKVHVTLGHPRKEIFPKVLWAAHARPEIARFVRDEYECADCQARVQQAGHRAVAIRRTVQFNEVIAVDTFNLSFEGACATGPTFRSWRCSMGPRMGAWKAFVRAWVGPFGPPEMLLLDGGPESEAHFERGLEHLGVFHRVVDSESPWGNGRAERCAGWVREILVRASESSVVTTRAKLETLLREVVPAKHRCLRHGGYSPFQLVYGTNPRLPNDLLSGDGIRQGAAAADYARQRAIRDLARQELFRTTSKRKLAEASKANVHPDSRVNP